MRCTQRVTCVIVVAVTGLASVATLAVASASAGGGLGQRVRGCITVTATVPVGRSPEQVAVDPKTNTAYVANFSTVRCR
jgi:DNA-binding beta-propeller fold protein YncE